MSTIHNLNPKKLGSLNPMLEYVYLAYFSILTLKVSKRKSAGKYFHTLPGTGVLNEKFVWKPFRLQVTGVRSLTYSLSLVYNSPTTNIIEVLNLKIKHLAQLVRLPLDISKYPALEIGRWFIHEHAEGSTQKLTAKAQEAIHFY